MTDGIRFPFDAPLEGQVVPVAEGITWLRLPLPMALDHVNIYVLDDGEGWTVIDTGFMSHRGEALWQALLDGPLSAKPVRRVVATHHHPDHIGMAGWFQARGAQLATTRTAWLYTRMLCLDVQETYPAESIAFYRAAGMPDDMLARRLAERPFNFADCVAPLPLGFLRLQDGQTIRMGQRDWTIRIGHGHAPEQATFWADGIVLGADQLLPGISANIGVYPSEPDADPLTEWLASCAAFHRVAQDDHLILPGHKLPYTGLPLRLTQMTLNHELALTRILETLTTPRTAHDIFPTLYRRDIGPAEYGLALVEAVAHMNCLLQRGLVSRVLAAGGRHLWQRL